MKYPGSAGLCLALLCASLLLQPANARAQGSMEAALLLTPSQAATLRIATARRATIQPLLEAVGTIDFNQDRLVQLFPSLSGRVAEVRVAAGDRVRAGQVLLLLDSPDLNQSEAALRSAAQATQHLQQVYARDQQLQQDGTLAQRDLEQAQSDLNAATVTLESARDTLRVQGATAEEIAGIEAGRSLHGRIALRAPVAGQVVTRAVSPGTLVNPQMSTAPITLADPNSIWLVAQLPETDVADVHIGQNIEATVPAYPGQRFHGRVQVINAALDPATHRLAVRSELSDPQQRLRPQMLAHFTLSKGTPHSNVLLPEAAVVREGDGSLSVWVARPGRRFERRTIRAGLIQAHAVEVLSGLEAGEQVVIDGGLYLSSAHALQAE